ncbi:hypothetical protein Tco_0277871 [Tanacetum coccineum]
MAALHSQPHRRRTPLLSPSSAPPSPRRNRCHHPNITIICHVSTSQPPSPPLHLHRRTTIPPSPQHQHVVHKMNRCIKVMAVSLSFSTSIHVPASLSSLSVVVFFFHRHVNLGASSISCV